LKIEFDPQSSKESLLSVLVVYTVIDMLSSLGGLFTSINIILSILLGSLTNYMFRRTIAKQAKEQYPQMFPESLAKIGDKILTSVNPLNICYMDASLEELKTKHQRFIEQSQSDKTMSQKSIKNVETKLDSAE